MWKILQPEDTLKKGDRLIYTRAEKLPPFPKNPEEALKELKNKQKIFEENAYRRLFGEDYFEKRLPLDELWCENNWGYYGRLNIINDLVKDVNSRWFKEDWAWHPNERLVNYTFAIWVDKVIDPNLQPTKQNTEANVTIYF